MKAFTFTKGNLYIRQLVPVPFGKNLLGKLKSYGASWGLGVGTPLEDIPMSSKPRGGVRGLGLEVS